MTDSSTYKLSQRISTVLRAGVIACFVIILAGLVLLAFSPGQSPMTVVPFQSLASELGRLNPLAVITAGVLLILVFPIVIIILLFIHYINVRDRRMIIICVILLVMLFISFIYAFK